MRELHRRSSFVDHEATHCYSRVRWKSRRCRTALVSGLVNGALVWGAELGVNETSMDQRRAFYRDWYSRYRVGSWNVNVASGSTSVRGMTSAGPTIEGA